MGFSMYVQSDLNTEVLLDRFAEFFQSDKIDKTYFLIFR